MRRFEEREIEALEQNSKSVHSRKASTDQEMDIEEHPLTLKTNPMLWAEKYRSYKFFDLLTDEALNRNVLTWLKSWDELVFPEKEVENLKAPAYLLKTYQTQNKFG